MEFSYLIIDANNLGYQIINSAFVDRSIIKLSKKYIYKNFVKKYIETISMLKEQYSSKEVILLFDNHNSKLEMKESFQIPKGVTRKEIKDSYKSSRKRETDEFYWSLDFLNYYYRISDSCYHTVQVLKLEADDLVAPCLNSIVQGDTALLVTNDSDWTKYLSKDIFYLASLTESPRGIDYIINRYNFYPSEDKIILYKILYGDTTDDIPMLFPEIKPIIRDQILQDFSSIFDLIEDGKNKEYMKPFLSLLKDREKELKINYQLLSAIPVSNDQFLSHYTTGRKAERLQQSVNAILYGEGKTEKSFVFGGIKLPRIKP